MSELVQFTARSPERAAGKAERALMRTQLSATVKKTKLLIAADVEQARIQAAAQVEQTRIQATEAVEVARPAAKIVGAGELGKVAAVTLKSLDNAVTEAAAGRPGLELQLRGIQDDIAIGTRNIVRSHFHSFL